MVLLFTAKSQNQLHFEAEVADLENFEASNENLIARDDLPCESDAALQLQCASVRRIVRLGLNAFIPAKPKEELTWP